MADRILFLCPHNAAKGVIAAAYFNHFAQQSELPLTADSAGTEPSEVVAPNVVTMLNHEGIDVSQHQPRRVNTDELAVAKRIISMGCTAEELGIEAERIEQWSDIPMVSKDPNGAREAIRAHVERLIAELRKRYES